MNSLTDHIAAKDPPTWFDEFTSAQHYARHIVLSGNIRDVFPVRRDGMPDFLDLFGVVRSLLDAQGIATILCHDPVTGLTLHGARRPDVESALRGAGIDTGGGALPLSGLSRVHAALAALEGAPTALVVDEASHLHGEGPGDLEDFFVRVGDVTRDMPQGGVAPVLTIWIAERSADLPDWFVIGNDLLRDIHVELPNLEDRFLFARHICAGMDLSSGRGPGEDDRLLQDFALECDGETLVAMRSVAEVAQAEGITLDRITDALRVYRTGIRRNPWNSAVLANRVRDAKTILQRRIKGQGRAIDKTVDILARSVIGLSGAQSGSRHLKPRGVLFLAGPTGVGKTELAKALTELLFGDETASHRFDMSEFMQEESIARLLGAPPGHPGHERGGELVNAAHRRPFSVFLFDEVEKAHPRILDVFLQILDEGRLTDSRGSTAHFSEALIVFTSNIGVMNRSRVVNEGMNVVPSDTHEELERKIGLSIQEHFRNELQRPELLNRIGQNIVVFDFLTGEAAWQIFDAMMDRVLATVRAERGMTIKVSDTARDKLRGLCIEDYFEGGRGIGNRIENHFINPLARAIFEANLRADVTVVDLTTTDGRTTLVLAPMG